MLPNFHDEITSGSCCSTTSRGTEQGAYALRPHAPALLDAHQVRSRMEEGACRERDKSTVAFPHWRRGTSYCCWCSLATVCAVVSFCAQLPPAGYFTRQQLLLLRLLLVAAAACSNHVFSGRLVQKPWRKTRTSGAAIVEPLSPLEVGNLMTGIPNLRSD